MKNTIAWTLVLVLASVGFLAVSARMHEQGSFDHKPDLFSLKGSPYGRTIAYAMRGPADLYWHRGQVEAHDEVRELNYVDLDTNSEGLSIASKFANLKREHEEEEAAEAAEVAEDEPLPPGSPLRERLLKSIKDLRATYYTRTSPFGDNPKVRSWRWSEFERRLGLSYEMDPANILCHGSYFLFVSEHVARDTSVEVQSDEFTKHRAKALRICLQTIKTCETRQDEPTALITGASAAHDAATLLGRGPDKDLEAVDAFNNIFVAFLNEYVSVRNAMIADGSWDNYSVYRQQEMEASFAVLRIVYHELQQLKENGDAPAPSEESKRGSGDKS